MIQDEKLAATFAAAAESLKNPAASTTMPKSAQFAGMAYTCKDVYPSGWPHVQPKGRKLTRTEYKERRAYAKDAQSWHEGRVYSLQNEGSRATAARSFHAELSRNFATVSLPNAAKNWAPGWLTTYRAQVGRMRVLVLEFASYQRAAYRHRVPFAPHPWRFFPKRF